VTDLVDLPTTGTKPAESVFARVLGRQPSDRERLEVYRIKDALGLDDNDALLAILLAFQNYQWLYEQHPARIEQAAQKAVAEVAKAAEASARAEVRKVRRALTEAVSRAADSVATARADVARRMARWWAAAGLTLFGGFCMVCGFELGRGSLPFWMHPELAQGGGALAKVAGAVLGAPAGWVALVLVLPVLVSTVTRSVDQLRDESLSVGPRRKAGALMVGAIGGWLVAAAVLSQLAFGWRR